MLSIGISPSQQNLLVGQVEDDVEVRLLHTGKDDTRGRPWLRTTDGVLSTGLVHIMHTYDGMTERLYINGVEYGTTIVRSGTFSNWRAEDMLTIGNEWTGDRPYAGTIRLVAIYDRGLTETEVQQNYSAGATGQAVP